MTEEMTLLAVVLFAYLVFRWMRERKIWLALLSGGLHRCGFASSSQSPFPVPRGSWFEHPCILGAGQEIYFQASVGLYVGFPGSPDSLADQRCQPAGHAMDSG